MSSTVLVTGASGYIGKFLAKKLTNANYCAIGAVREIGNYSKSHGYQTIRPIGSIDGSTSWESALQGVDYVVHLAGCAHKLGKKPKNLVEQFKTVNTEATANLIEQCVKHGIKRFIFISSIGVLGELLPTIALTIQRMLTRCLKWRLNKPLMSSLDLIWKSLR